MVFGQAQASEPPDPVLAAAKAATDAGDLPRAMMLYKQAAAAGQLDAEVQLARLSLEGGPGITTDSSAATAWAQKAADSGDARGFLYLGMIWNKGLGVTANSQKALGYLHQADNAGDAKAARYIGLILGQAGDQQNAVLWFRKGAEAGDITSQYYLGPAYENGAGSAKILPPL